MIILNLNIPIFGLVRKLSSQAVSLRILTYLRTQIFLHNSDFVSLKIQTFSPQHSDFLSPQDFNIVIRIKIFFV